MDLGERNNHIMGSNVRFHSPDSELSLTTNASKFNFNNDINLVSGRKYLINNASIPVSDILNTASLYWDGEKLGIGTSTPTASIEISNDTGQDRELKISAGSGKDASLALFEHNTGDSTQYGARIMYDGGSNKIFIKTTEAGVESTRMTIKRSNGFCGLGETSPDSLLHLKGGGDVQIHLEADSDDTGESDNPTILFSQDGGLVTTTTGINSSNHFVIKQNYASAKIIFNVDGEDVVKIKKLDTKLECSGSIKCGINNYLKLEDNKISCSSGNLELDVAGDITLNSDSGNVIFKDESYGIYGKILHPGVGKFDISSEVKIVLRSDANEVLTCNTNNERVGINKEPDYSLDVLGDINFSSNIKKSGTNLKLSDLTNDLIITPSSSLVFYQLVDISQNIHLANPSYTWANSAVAPYVNNGSYITSHISGNSEIIFTKAGYYLISYLLESTDADANDRAIFISYISHLNTSDVLIYNYNLGNSTYYRDNTDTYDYLSLNNAVTIYISANDKIILKSTMKDSMDVGTTNTKTTTSHIRIERIYYTLTAP